MVWKKQYKKRVAKPNSESNNPVINFRSNLNPETLAYVKKMKKLGKGSEFMNQAVESYYFHLKNPKQFWKQIIEWNFGTIRHLLRQIGRKKIDDNNIHNNK